MAVNAAAVQASSTFWLWVVDQSGALNILFTRIANILRKRGVGDSAFNKVCQTAMGALIDGCGL